MAPSDAADLGQRAGPDPGQDRGDQDDHREQVEQIHAPEYRRGRRTAPPTGRPAPRRQSMVTVTGGASPNAVIGVRAGLELAEVDDRPLYMRDLDARGVGRARRCPRGR